MRLHLIIASETAELLSTSLNARMPAIIREDKVHQTDFCIHRMKVYLFIK